MISRIKPVAVAVGLFGLVNSQGVMSADNDWIKGVTVDGLVEVEAGYEKSYWDENSSDLVLATANLGFTGKVNEWSTVRLSFLYEDVTPLQIDETYITLGNLNKFPLYVKVGRVYLPFGRYESELISDPVTYDMADTMEEIGQLGFEAGGAYGSAYIYNGKSMDDGNDTLDHYGATLGFAKESEAMSFDIGVDYLSDFGDLYGVWATVGENVSTAATNYDYVAGLAGHAKFNFGPVYLIGEYMTALDPFKPEFLAFGNEGAEPQAWYTELGFTFKVGEREFTLGAGYAATEEAVALGLPKERYTVGVGLGIVDNTTVKLEYRVDSDYDESDGGTGEQADAATMQFAVNF